MKVYAMDSRQAFGIAVTVNDDRTVVTVRCLDCGRTWKPAIDKKGTLGADWHRCPAGCKVGLETTGAEYFFTVPTESKQVGVAQALEVAPFPVPQFLGALVEQISRPDDLVVPQFTVRQQDATAMSSSSGSITYPSKKSLLGFWISCCEQAHSRHVRGRPSGEGRTEPRPI